MSKYNTAASIAFLLKIKDVTPEIARLVRAAWTVDHAVLLTLMAEHAPRATSHYNACYTLPKTREIRRTVIDELIGTYGVEFLGTHRRTGNSIYYCNAGDTYATTVLFQGARLTVGCWGYLVERNLVR